MVRESADRDANQYEGFNILFLAPMISLDSTYGDGLHMTKLAEALVSRGNNQVTIIARGTHDFGIYSDRITVHRVPRMAMLSCGMAALKALLLSRRIRFDFVYERGWYMSAGHMASWLNEIPLVFEADGFAFETFSRRSIGHRILRHLMKWLERRTYRLARMVVAPSPSVNNTLLTELGVRDENIAMIPTGASPMPESETGLSLVDDDDSPKRQLILFFAGRLVNWHGLDVVIDAFAQCENLREDFVFKIAGDGPLREVLQERVRNHGLQGTVCFLGKVSRDVVHMHILESDACMAPLSEGKSGFALKIYEYMAFGKPIIASRISDHLMIEKEGIGLLFEPGSSDDLCRCLSHFRADRADISSKAVRGRELVKSTYNWDSVADSILGMIRPLTKRGE